MAYLIIVAVLRLGGDSMKIPKLGNNKFSREVTYKTVFGILHVLQRFSRSTGITDINQLSDYVCSLTVDEFCDYKFKDEPPELEEDPDL